MPGTSAREECQGRAASKSRAKSQPQAHIPCKNPSRKRTSPAKIPAASAHPLQKSADELQKSALEWRNPSRGRTSAENHAGERQQSSRQAASREPQAASCENQAGKRENQQKSSRQAAKIKPTSCKNQPASGEIRAADGENRVRGSGFRGKLRISADLPWRFACFCVRFATHFGFKFFFGISPRLKRFLVKHI